MCCRCRRAVAPAPPAFSETPKKDRRDVDVETAEPPEPPMKAHPLVPNSGHHEAAGVPTFAIGETVEVYSIGQQMWVAADVIRLLPGGGVHVQYKDRQIEKSITREYLNSWNIRKAPSTMPPPLPAPVDSAWAPAPIGTAPLPNGGPPALPTLQTEPVEMDLVTAAHASATKHVPVLVGMGLHFAANPLAWGESVKCTKEPEVLDVEGLKASLVQSGLGPEIEMQYLEKAIQLDTERKRCRSDFQYQQAVLVQLDAQTTVSRLVIELRSSGYLHISGKDTGGIYQRLGSWLREQLNFRPSHHILRRCPVVVEDQNQECEVCEVLEGWMLAAAEDWEECSDATFICGDVKPSGEIADEGIFATRGSHGENNMDPITMLIVDYMMNACGWSLVSCSGVNLGLSSQLREHEIMFTAPHSSNVHGLHMMIELRQSGYVEITGPHFAGLDEWLCTQWCANPVEADAVYSDYKYVCGAFNAQGFEHNMGLRSTELINFMVKEYCWTLITCNYGYFNADGSLLKPAREQQLVFRYSEPVERGEDHIVVELRDLGDVTISGVSSIDEPSFIVNVQKFLIENWGCKEFDSGFWRRGSKLNDLKFATPNSFFYKDHLTSDLGKRSIELAYFLASQGWMLKLCSGASMRIDSVIHREQQIIFTRAQLDEPAEPLLLIEFRAIPTDRYGNYKCFIQVSGLDINKVFGKLTHFFEQAMMAKVLGHTCFCDLLLSCRCLVVQDSSADPQDWRSEGRLAGENNFAKYTTRLCDFLVDHLDEWDVLVSNANNLDAYFSGQGFPTRSREQQLIFRHRPPSRAASMPDCIVPRTSATSLGRPPLEVPSFWTSDTRMGLSLHQVVSASEEEIEWLQQLLDESFDNGVRARANVLMRDGKGNPLASRLVVVSALRSEHHCLWERYAIHRRQVLEDFRSSGALEDELVVPKTVDASRGLSERCAQAEYGDVQSLEAYLMHGTKPALALPILRHSFKLDPNGKGEGTIFGHGIYLAEASNKADQVASEDTTGGVHDGLCCMMVCRTVLGRAHVVKEPGDYRDECTSGRFGVLVGDFGRRFDPSRAFVFFNEASVYPEFAIMYRRQFPTCDHVPSTL